jgi:hypothetical protein
VNCQKISCKFSQLEENWIRLYEENINLTAIDFIIKGNKIVSIEEPKISKFELGNDECWVAL